MHRASATSITSLLLLSPCLPPLLLAACQSNETESPETTTGLHGKFEIQKSLALDFHVDDELEMETSRGALRVFPMDGKGARIEATITAIAETDAVAQALVQRVHIEIVKRGQTHRPKIGRDSGTSWSPRHVVAVSYTAYVPAETSVRMRNVDGIHEVHGPFRGIYLSSKHGDIFIQDAKGSMRLRTQHGKVTMRNISGEEIEVDTWSGKVDLTQVEARHLTVRTKAGAIRMEGVQAQKILTRSSYGDMELSGLRGDLIAQNKSGTVEIVGLTEGHHEINTTDGEVHIRGATGDLEIHTTSAPIWIDDFRGEADLESLSGDIRVAGRFGQLRCATKSGRIRARAAAGSKADRPWRFTSHFGEISLGLRQQFPCVLTLSTESGSFENKLKLSKILSRDSTSLRGQIGEGGQEVHLSSSTGKVEVFTLAAGKAR